jgi:hypothetical protein
VSFVGGESRSAASLASSTRPSIIYSTATPAGVRIEASSNGVQTSGQISVEVSSLESVPSEYPSDVGHSVAEDSNETDLTQDIGNERKVKKLAAKPSYEFAQCAVVWARNPVNTAEKNLDGILSDLRIVSSRKSPRIRWIGSCATLDQPMVIRSEIDYLAQHCFECGKIMVSIPNNAQRKSTLLTGARGTQCTECHDKLRVVWNRTTRRRKASQGRS